jgi:hypothetical protein
LLKKGQDYLPCPLYFFLVGLSLGDEDLADLPLRLTPNTIFLDSAEPFAFAIIFSL